MQIKGLRKWQFDVWSNDVTLANQLESSGLPGRVHVSKATANCLDGAFELEPVEKARNEYLRLANVETFFIRPNRSSGSKQASSSRIGGLVEELEEEENGDQWEPEIPFINLNKLDDETTTSNVIERNEKHHHHHHDEDHDENRSSNHGSSLNKSNRKVNQIGADRTSCSMRKLNLTRTFKRSNTSREPSNMAIKEEMSTLGRKHRSEQNGKQQHGNSFNAFTSLGFYRSFNIRSQSRQEPSALSRSQHSMDSSQGISAKRTRPRKLMESLKRRTKTGTGIGIGTTTTKTAEDTASSIVSAPLVLPDTVDTVPESRRKFDQAEANSRGDSIDLRKVEKRSNDVELAEVETPRRSSISGGSTSLVSSGTNNEEQREHLGSSLVCGSSNLASEAQFASKSMVISKKSGDLSSNSSGGSGAGVEMITIPLETRKRTSSGSQMIPKILASFGLIKGDQANKYMDATNRGTKSLVSWSNNDDNDMARDRDGDKDKDNRQRGSIKDGRKKIKAIESAKSSMGSAKRSDGKSIEVEISRRMMEEHINWFRLMFKDKTLEETYCQIRNTSSKSSIVYIMFTWILMALVSLLSLPNFWTALKIVVITTVPLFTFALFYMSDSILYSRYMRLKLKEASTNMRQARNSDPLSRSSCSSGHQRQQQQSPTTANETTGRASGTESEAASSTRGENAPSEITFDGTSRTSTIFGHHHQLIHRVAKFWSKLDRIPMIWNIFIFTFILIMTVASIQLNYLACNFDSKQDYASLYVGCDNNTKTNETICNQSIEPKICLHQENLMFNMILVMIEMGAFFRSSYLRKVILLASMSGAFLILLHWINIQLASSLVFSVAFDHVSCPLLSFQQESKEHKLRLSQILEHNYLSPYTLGGAITQCDPNLIEKSYLVIGAILIGLIYVCRSTERISRLDFLLKLQAGRELQNMRILRHCNTQLLENILPDHVAAHFLEGERDSEELYAKSFDCVAVIFASIPNFSNFYSEDVNNGIECIRLLNEIIFDFDQLLEDEQFKSLEKVKTVSSTYMAACGLNPRDQSMTASYHLATCCRFAFAMKQALQEVNVHSFNNFEMRFGISHGPIVGGVIGAKKPVFDIWGDIVNEASRMDSTGTNGMIQVPKRSAEILAASGFVVQLRGVIPVKGKGDMETYYVIEQAPTVPTRPQLSNIPIEVKLNGNSNVIDESNNVLNIDSEMSNRAPTTSVKIIEPTPETQEESEAVVETLIGEPSLLKPDSLSKRGLRRDRKSSQSMRNPGERRFKLIGARINSPGQYEFGHNTNPSSRDSTTRHNRRAFMERQSSVSRERMLNVRDAHNRRYYLDRSTGDSEDLLISSDPKSSPICQGSEENSLPAVFFNMVRMRKEYENSLANFSPSQSGQTSDSMDREVDSNFGPLSAGDASGTSLASSISFQSNNPRYTSFVRPKSAQTSMRRGQKARASLFWHRNQSSKSKDDKESVVERKESINSNEPE